MVAPQNATEDAPGTGWDPQKPNSELQQHVNFFDKDKDGIIWPSDTFISFRELGFGYLWAMLGVVCIHGAFSWITWGSVIPDLYFRLRVNRMHKAKHGSDTEIYTGTGEFDLDRFEYMWYMYTTHPHTHITFKETLRMVRGDRNPLDPYGWSCALFEWVAVFMLLGAVDGQVSKEDVKGIYDGSLFWKIAERNKKKKKNTARKRGQTPW